MNNDHNYSEGNVERLPPQSIEAEQAILGSILINPDTVTKICDVLQPDNFYRKAHQVIYAAILDLFEKGEPIDTVTVSQYLKDQGKLDSVGGRQYLTDLGLSIATTANAEYYSKTVTEKSTLRNLIKAGTEIVASCYEDNDADLVVDKAEQLIFNIAQHRNLGALIPIKDIVNESFARIEQRYENRDALSGLSTGFYDLDEMTSGWQKSDLVIIAARPSMGKTALVLNLAQHAAVECKAPTAVFSLEMSKEQLVQRLLCAEARIDANKMRTGFLQSSDWQNLAAAMGRLGEAPLFIDDSATITALDVRAKARRLKAECKGLGLIIIDYIQLMQGRARSDGNRVQEVSEISRGLKQLARELNCPVIALSQLSRAVEARQNKRPMLSDLRESGCLTGESLVFLPDTGEYVRIDSLVGKDGFNVMAVDTSSWKLVPKPVTKAFPTGVKPVFKIVTRSNRTIRATANHKFLTMDGWMRLDELVPGSHLATPRKLPASGQQTMTNSELGLLGLLIGDGCTLARHAIQYTTADRDLADLAADLAQNIFNKKVTPRVKAEREWIQVYLASSTHLTHGKRNPVAQWLDKLGIFNLRSFEKRVPKEVFRQPKSAIAAFLRHLWATDGSVHLSGKRPVPRLFYATSSQELARDVRSLLLRFEINARIKQIPQPGKGRDMFMVIVSGKPDMLSFMENIGILGERKQSMAQSVFQHLCQVEANTNRDVIPQSAWASIVEPARAVAGLSTRGLQSALNMAYCGSSLYKTGISRDRALRVANAVNCLELTALASSDVYWDEIVAIEPDGEEQVYDLTVDELHNFVANDIIVHNSIEQDADIVMFIYRDDYYNQESEKRGEAEIIIAKQRNGPVGTVELLYQASITRFLNKASNNQYAQV